MPEAWASGVRGRLVKALPLLADLAVVVIAYLLAFVLRFDGVRRIPVQHISQFWLFLWVLPILRIVANAAWGLYRHVWRYVGTRDVVSIALATFTGSAIFALLVLMTGQQGFPRSVIGIEFLLSLVLMMGARVLWRAWAERPGDRRGSYNKSRVRRAG